jgi:hypothetical protein
MFLIDRSDSMQRPWAGTGLSLAQGAARAINKILLELCVKSTKEQGGALRGIVPLPELADHPIAVREEPAVDAVLSNTRVPAWIDPYAGFRTPMCQAVATAGAYLYDWAGAFPDSFPPIVINITDGMVTDSPYEGADIATWAQRLVSIATGDGPALLFNIFLSPDAQPGVWFPPSGAPLPDPGPGLLSISSPLPQPMVDNARSAQIQVPAGARGFVFNADLAMLVKFLEIGTRFDVRDR